MTEGELFCHLRSAERRGTPAAMRDCTRLGEVWVCAAHAEHLYRRGLLQPILADAEDGERISDRCTGTNDRAERCEKLGVSYYPAMPRCPRHEDQVPTRWDIEAEDEAPRIVTRWDAADAAQARREARTARHKARAAADAARDWERLRRRGRSILAEARAGQGTLALDA